MRSITIGEELRQLFKDHHEGRIAAPEFFARKKELLDYSKCRLLRRLPPRLQRGRGDSVGRRLTRWLLVFGYGFAGYQHLTAPAGFIAIVPQWVPHPGLVIWATGWCELAGALGLLISRALISQARPAAAVGLALYALAVWPANFNHALNDIPINGVQLSWWYHGPRLLLQPVLVWAALWVGGFLDWPFKSPAHHSPPPPRAAAGPC